MSRLSVGPGLYSIEVMGPSYERGCRMRRALLLALGLLVCETGCGGNPLIGTWTAAVSHQSGATDNLAFTLNSNGSLGISLTGTGTCSGSLSWAGMTWTSTGSTVSLAGSPTCSGAGVSCPPPVGTLTCGSTGPGADSCSYALSNNNRSLTLTGCSTSVYNATYTKF